MSDTSATGLYAVCSVLLGISVIAVAVRFYARHLKKAPLLADDWLLIPALLAFIGACSCIYFGESIKVFGYSSNDFTKEEIAATLERSDKTQLAFNLLSVAGLGFSKMSALFFYKRIFCVGGRKAIFNMIVLISIVIVALWLIAFEFTVGFQCGVHFSAQWEGTAAKYCKIVFPMLLGLTISDFLLDIWVLGLPIYPILKLQTPLPKKTAILGIFLLASTGLGASIARLYTTVDFFIFGRTRYHKSDTEQILSRLIFYMVLELGIGIIAICLPSIWMVIVAKAPEAFLRSVNSLVSLASLGSRHSKRSQENLPSRTLQSNASASSQAPIAGPSVEAHELSTAKRDPLDPVPESQTHVSRSLEQSFETRKQEEV